MLARNDTLVKTQVRLSSTSKKVILTILYHEIFSYPLTANEIQERVNSTEITEQQLRNTLDELVELEYLREEEGFYMAKLRPDWIRRREAAALLCKKVEAKALRRAKLISKFPFVRAVFFSGTFAKGQMTIGSDVDFFIITASSRLWLARTLLVLFKKICLFNSRKYFCVNYFIDEMRLAIQERNLFTATEIATLRPAYGKSLYERFQSQNSWIKKYYPNFQSRIDLAHDLKSSLLKQRIESMLTSSWGKKLEDFFYRKTLQYWKNKFDWMDDETFAIALKSKSWVSKHHPNNFQERVLRKYYFAIEEFEKLHNVRIRLLDLA